MSSTVTSRLVGFIKTFLLCMPPWVSGLCGGLKDTLKKKKKFIKANDSTAKYRVIGPRHCDVALTIQAATLLQE